MGMRFEQQRALTLVGIRVTGTLKELGERVPDAWLQLMRALDQIPNQADATLFYGVCPESDFLERGVNGVYTYWVSTEASAVGPLPEGFETLNVPRGEFAVATCKGPGEQIPAVYRQLASWIEAEGRKTDSGAYSFEQYDIRRQPPTPPYREFDYEIWKPLA